MKGREGKRTEEKGGEKTKRRGEEMRGEERGKGKKNII